MKVILTTQMRTGSTWLTLLLSGLLGKDMYIDNLGKNVKIEEFEQKLKPMIPEVIKTHNVSPERLCKLIDKIKRDFYVITTLRDFKDLTLSKILHIRYNKPLERRPDLWKLLKVRKDFGNKWLNDIDYINAFIQSPFFDEFIKNWKIYHNDYKHPRYLKVSYEEMKENIFGVLKKICEFIGLKKNNQELNDIISAVQNTFEEHIKNGPNYNAIWSPRKGIVGDYKNYLNEKSIKKIDNIK